MASKSFSRTSLSAAWEEISPSFSLDDELESLLLMYLNSPEIPDEDKDRGSTCVHSAQVNSSEALKPPERFARRRRLSHITPHESDNNIPTKAKTSPNGLDGLNIKLSPIYPVDPQNTIESANEMDLAFTAVNKII
jgi:hypothetical protein